MNPLISIVIANYNYGRFLEDAICSVLGQGVDDEVELIICDAASTDNSVDIIRKYSDRIAWWCSEKDDGQSAAFNKGFSHARGRYLTWLNADDVLVPGCLKVVLSQMRKHRGCEWFTGNYFRFLDSNKSIIEVGWGPHWYPFFLQRRSSPLVIFGPTSFFSRRIYENVGKINESMHYCMDNDLWYRFVLAGFKQRRIRCLCWAFRMHEASKTAEFEGHRTSESAREKGSIEFTEMNRRTGYRMSEFMRLVNLAWRVFDGSLIIRFFLHWKMIGEKFNAWGGRIHENGKPICYNARI